MLLVIVIRRTGTSEERETGAGSRGLRQIVTPRGDLSRAPGHSGTPDLLFIGLEAAKLKNRYSLLVIRYSVMKYRDGRGSEGEAGIGTQELGYRNQESGSSLKRPLGRCVASRMFSAANLAFEPLLCHAGWPMDWISCFDVIWFRNLQSSRIFVNRVLCMS
jgi:hypothetical protein